MCSVIASLSGGIKTLPYNGKTVSEKAVNQALSIIHGYQPTLTDFSAEIAEAKAAAADAGMSPQAAQALIDTLMQDYDTVNNAELETAAADAKAAAESAKSAAEKIAKAKLAQLTSDAKKAAAKTKTGNKRPRKGIQTTAKPAKDNGLN